MNPKKKKEVMLTAELPKCVPCAYDIIVLCTHSSLSAVIIL